MEWSESISKAIRYIEDSLYDDANVEITKFRAVFPRKDMRDEAYYSEARVPVRKK